MTTCPHCQERDLSVATFPHCHQTCGLVRCVVCDGWAAPDGHLWVESDRNSIGDRT